MRLPRVGRRKRKRGEITISATVIRADGRVEDLGVIARGKTDRWKTEAKGG